MKVCELTAEGWRKTKNGVFRNETGTFFGKEGRIVFVGWSGSHVLVVDAA